MNVQYTWSVVPPPSLIHQSRPLIAWIWYGAPIGRRFCSRTQKASSEAGAATTLSALSDSSTALVTGVPRSCPMMTTSSFISL